MATKPKTPSLLTMNQLVDGVFKIKAADVKRIVGSRPGKGKKS